jgi:hypothetical protein
LTDCKSCKSGSWGTKCEKKCTGGPKCNGPICDPVTGKLTKCTSCLDKYTGTTCTVAPGKKKV